MAITIYNEASPLLTGPAAYQIGLGEGLRQQQEDALRQQQFAEQQRQFDAGHAMDQQRLAMQQQDMAFNQDLQRHRESLAQRGLGLDFLNRDDEMGMRLMSQGMQDSSQLTSQMLQNYFGNQRQERAYQQQEQSQFNEALWRERAAIKQNILRQLPTLNPEERKQVVDQFNREWGGMGFPALHEADAPPVPEYMDPQKAWERARADQEASANDGYRYTLVPDENGMPSRMRGEPAYPQTPAGMREEAKNKLTIKQMELEIKRDIETSKSEQKLEEYRQKASDRQKERQEKRQDAIHDRAIEHAQSQIEAKVKGVMSRKPKKSDFTHEVNGLKTVDEDGWQIASENYNNDLRAAIAEYETLDALDAQLSGQAPPQQGAPPSPTLPPPQQPGQRIQVQSSRDQPIAVKDIADAMRYAPYTWVRTPDGRVGQLKQ